MLAAPEVGVQFAGVSGCLELQSTNIVEVFSPERFGKLCKEYGLEQGIAMDIKNGYDFDLAADRARCWETIKREEPLPVIGSPPCTLFSRLRELNKFMYPQQREVDEGVRPSHAAGEEVH